MGIHGVVRNSLGACRAQIQSSFGDFVRAGFGFESSRFRGLGFRG